MQDTELMLHTLLELGESMLADGAEVRRVEQTLTRMGMAYGAVHALFFDPAIRRGVALLTSGASEARRGVLADLNAGVIRYLWHMVFNEKGTERSGWIE